MKEYEELVEQNKKENEKYLKEFKDWLTKSNLSKKTIEKHISNADLFINDYLNYYNATKMKEGISSVSSFLGDWFIRKCMWSTAYTIKETASSIKKFYKCMSELGYVEAKDYEFLVSILKEEMKDYIREVNDYNSDTYSDWYVD